MDRRDFLKLLAATSLGAFGTPDFGISKAFAGEGKPKATKRTKLKDAVEALKDDPEGFVYLLGATYSQTSPDLRLSCAAVYYYVDIGGNVNKLIRTTTKLKGEPGVVEFLEALRAALNPHVSNPENRIYTRTYPYGIRRLEVESRIITSVWHEITPAEALDRAHGKERGIEIIAAYVAKYGSTIALLEMADAEVVI